MSISYHIEDPVEKLLYTCISRRAVSVEDVRLSILSFLGVDEHSRISRMISVEWRAMRIRELHFDVQDYIGDELYPGYERDFMISDFD